LLISFIEDYLIVICLVFNNKYAEKSSSFGAFVETILRQKTRIPYPELGLKGKEGITEII
jgi:hypothetical protein